MPLKRAPTAVAFDLDGVLLDTEPLYTQVTQEIVGEYGKVFDWSLKAKTIGRGDVDSAGVLIRELGLPFEPREYLARRNGRLRELFDDVAAIPGAPEFVKALHDRRIPCAVATSSSQELFELKTSKHSFIDLIDVVVCGDDPAVERKKPAPDIFLHAARRLGVAPADCLVLEDAPAGVAAAVAAGMQVLAMPDPHVDRAEVAHADLIVSGYADFSLADLGL